MSDEEQQAPAQVKGVVPDHVDRENPWWMLVINLASPFYQDTVKIESNNPADLLPKVVDLDFEEYGDAEGRVQVRRSQVMQRTYLLVKPQEPETTTP